MGMSASAATALTSSFGSCTQVTIAKLGGNSAILGLFFSRLGTHTEALHCRCPCLHIQQSAACDGTASDKLSGPMHTQFVTQTL